MKVLKQIGWSTLALAFTCAAAAAPPPIPDTPAPVLDIVHAVPFTLDESYTHLWRAEKPEVRTGYLVVLKVEPDLVYPRQRPEPVLYVANQTAERLNVGYRSGHVVAIVPAVLDDVKHPDYIDLAKASIWFGTPGMPEQIDREQIATEITRAARQRIRPLPAARVEAARTTGGEMMREETKNDLVRRAAELVRRYSPQEEDRADALAAQ